MIFPNDVIKRLERHYAAQLNSWVHDRIVDRECFNPSLSIPLHAPSERTVLQDRELFSRWMDSWRRSSLRQWVRWERRQWPSVGHQNLPIRFEISGALSIAACIGKTKEWSRLSERSDALLDVYRSLREIIDLACVASEVQRQTRRLVALDERDWATLLSVIQWLGSHPDVSCYVRQLPIRGIDTKWIENHHSLVLALVKPLENVSELPFTKPPEQLRLRLLDDRLAVMGMTDISASPEELNKLSLRPESIIVCENLTTLLTLPPMPATVGVWGRGYAVSIVADVDWIRTRPILYWGDLDSNGFAILDRLRHHHSHVTSIFMDLETLERFRDLCVEEPSPVRREMELLSPAEHEVLRHLLDHEPALRLEQERISWEYVLSCLEPLANGSSRL